MKYVQILIFSCIFTHFLYGQNKGNVNYKAQVRLSDNNINIEPRMVSNVSSEDNLLNISVKGMANIKADTYVAIFSTTQVGKTAKEVNDLLKNRINQAISGMKSKGITNVYIDMISFVPIYEYEVDKKVFSKKTYNEVPSGFELKKNIHIKYTDPNLLGDIISILADLEIYDLVRVDYFSKQLAEVKKQLRLKARAILEEKLKMNYEIMGITSDTLEKQLFDDYKVLLPIEMYKSYQAYHNTSLNNQKKNVQQADKAITSYYQPILDKEFDFVINPVILEPVIQVMYQMVLKVNEKGKRAVDKAQKTENHKTYILVTPNGQLRELPK